MSSAKCPCWAWAQADADDLDDLMDHGHRRGCKHRDRVEIEQEMDEDLFAEIMASYNDEDE